MLLDSQPSGAMTTGLSSQQHNTTRPTFMTTQVVGKLPHNLAPTARRIARRLHGPWVDRDRPCESQPP